MDQKNNQVAHVTLFDLSFTARSTPSQTRCHCPKK